MLRSSLHRVLILFFLLIGYQGNLLLALWDPSSVEILRYSGAEHTNLVNSVDFHPTDPLFCVTYSRDHFVVIYKITEDGQIEVFQALDQPSSKLDSPQHALFSQDGQSLLAVNWAKQTFNIYPLQPDGYYQSDPIATIPCRPPMDHDRPHGMAFSHDGNYLGVAYGCSCGYPRSVALYQVNDLGKSSTSIELIDALTGNEIDIGIPKGISFSPDDSHLFITLPAITTIASYAIDWDTEKMNPIPKQLLNNPSLSLPEDIKFSPDGSYVAVSNSNKNAVFFYAFDKSLNTIEEPPIFIMQSPESTFDFPHGLAFSPDDKYFCVTQMNLVLLYKAAL